VRRTIFLLFFSVSAFAQTTYSCPSNQYVTTQLVNTGQGCSTLPTSVTINGAALPSSATVVGTNSSGQVVAVPSQATATVLAAPSGAAGVPTFRALVATDIPTIASTKVSGLAASATTDTTNATNITSGMLPVSQLPTATTATLGAVKPDGTTITVSGGVISATGGGSGSTFQQNGTALTSSATVNFESAGSTVTITNPSAGNVNIETSKPYAGSGTAIATGPNSGTTNGHIVEYNGTTGQQADSGFVFSNLAQVSSSNTFTANNTFSGFILGGTTFTITSGCGTTTSLAGGRQAGSFVAGQTACAPVITPGVTAPHGFSCWANDLTTNADTVHQIATTTTTATLSGTVVSGDTINFGCVAY